MDGRLDPYQNTVALKVAKHVICAAHVTTEAIVPTVSQELVKLRASLITGCGDCADMHRGGSARRRQPDTHQPCRNLAGANLFHRPRARGPRARRAGHPDHRRGRRPHRRGMGNGHRALRPGTTRRAGLPDRPHQLPTG